MLLHDPEDATMSKTTPVEFRGRSFWAFDVSLSILLAELIESVRDGLVMWGRGAASGRGR
jgi:hypothetical protein